MGLPACQERMLAGIEDELRKGAPRLVSRFAIFTRLTSDEELPRTERLAPRRWQDRIKMPGVILVPLVLFALATALFFASVSGAARTCAAAVRRPGVAAPRWVPCTVTGTQGHGPAGTAGAGVGTQGAPR